MIEQIRIFHTSLKIVIVKAINKSAVSLVYKENKYVKLCFYGILEFVPTSAPSLTSCHASLFIYTTYVKSNFSLLVIK